MESPSSISGSLIVSAAGWILAVASVALALFVGKPYYAAKGYEQGRASQAQTNIEAVDEILASRIVEGSEYVVLGNFVEVNEGSIVIETLNPYLRNPLRTTARRQTVLVDAATIVEKRTMLPIDEFIKAQEDARRKGLSTQEAIVHKTEPLTLDQIPAGTEIRVYPKVAQDAVKDAFAAKQILWVISSQQPSTNQAQL